MKQPMKWAYGITTVPQRKSVFAKTVESLSKAGFDDPWLFVDSYTPEYNSYTDFLSYNRAFRHPQIGAYGNWLLALWELHIREPNVDRFALFQDDITVCLGLRSYLERCPYPGQSYLNLCTYPVNQELIESMGHDSDPGWYPSNQKGKGAQALVFSNEAVQQLLKQPELVEHVHTVVHRQKRNIAGAVLTAFKRIGWQEYVHYPGLVDHVGARLNTTAHSQPQPPITCFAGNDFNAMDFLCKKAEKN